MNEPVQSIPMNPTAQTIGNIEVPGDQNHANVDSDSWESRISELKKHCAWNLAIYRYLDELDRISKFVNGFYNDIKAKGGQCYLERPGDLCLRIVKPSYCRYRWIALPVIENGRRKIIRFGPKHVGGIGEGQYFLTGTDGCRIPFEVPTYPRYQIVSAPTDSQCSNPSCLSCKMNFL